VRQAGGEFVGDLGHRRGPCRLRPLRGVGIGGRGRIGGLQADVGFLDPLSGVRDAGQEARFLLQVNGIGVGELPGLGGFFPGLGGHVRPCG
jgi:hypothetical protein